MKCAFKECNNEAQGAKQDNTYVVRIYLCWEHLKLVAQVYDLEELIKIINGI